MNSNETQFHNNNPIPKQKLSKQNEDVLNNVSASGFKQFHV